MTYTNEQLGRAMRCLKRKKDLGRRGSFRRIAARTRYNTTTVHEVMKGNDRTFMRPEQVDACLSEIEAALTAIEAEHPQPVES